MTDRSDRILAALIGIVGLLLAVLVIFAVAMIVATSRHQDRYETRLVTIKDKYEEGAKSHHYAITIAERRPGEPSADYELDSDAWDKLEQGRRYRCRLRLPYNTRLGP